MDTTISSEIVDMPTEPTFINGEEYRTLTSQTVTTESSEIEALVFFWNPRTGANAIAFNP